MGWWFPRRDLRAEEREAKRIDVAATTVTLVGSVVGIAMWGMVWTGLAALALHRVPAPPPEWRQWVGVGVFAVGLAGGLCCGCVLPIAVSNRLAALFALFSWRKSRLDSSTAGYDTRFFAFAAAIALAWLLLRVLPETTSVRL